MTFGATASILSALSWATALLLFRAAPASAGELNLFKNSFSLVCLLLTLPWIDDARWLWSSEESIRLAISGGLGIGVADTLFLRALQRLGATGAAIVECTYPVWVILLSWLLLGEVMSGTFIASAGLVLLGVTVAAASPPPSPSPHSSPGDSKESETQKNTAEERTHEQLQALGLGLVAMLLMAVGVIVAKPVLDANELCSVTTARLFWGIVAQSAWLLLSSQCGVFQVLRPHRRWKELAPPAFLGTYIAMLLWLAGMKYAPLSLSTILSQLAPIFTLILARFVFLEPLNRARIFGVLCASAGTISALSSSGG